MSKFQTGDVVRIIGGNDEWEVEKAYEWSTRIKNSEVNFVVPCKNLELVRRPKKMVTKTAEVWMNVYPDTHCVFESKRDADNSVYVRDRIACVHLTGSYEVEEE